MTSERMTHWMNELAAHYARMRERHPDETLLILFDIDGTILDTRHMVRHHLLAYDRAHGTSLFHGLRLEDVTTHENHVDRLLVGLGLPSSERARVLEWYQDHRWRAEGILASHRPYQGVLEIIRWFQLQPRTHVGLNTGRPEWMRGHTLRALNRLGREYRVSFASDLLHMNSGGWESVGRAKVEGLQSFHGRGYRVFAVVDDEPDNIEAMMECDRLHEILFLHAETLFDSRRRVPARAVGGKVYDITQLVTERDLPRHVQLVWHGVNDRVSLGRFLRSEIGWGECKVRRDPLGRIVLRAHSFESHPWNRREEPFLLKDCVAEFEHAGKGIKLDLTDRVLIDRVSSMLVEQGFPGDRVWFSGSLENLGEDGFRRLSEAWPDAVIQCPVDFLVPIMIMPGKAREVLQVLRDWGVNRFSLNWKTESRSRAFETLESWGCEVNFYNVPDLEAFLRASLLLPRSITSDFRFPQWRLGAEDEDEAAAAEAADEKPSPAAATGS
jgi:hypothetical protein